MALQHVVIICDTIICMLHVHQNTLNHQKEKFDTCRQQESKSDIADTNETPLATTVLSLEQGRQAFLHIGLGRQDGSLRLSKAPGFREGTECQILAKPNMDSFPSRGVIS